MKRKSILLLGLIIVLSGLTGCNAPKINSSNKSEERTIKKEEAPTEESCEYEFSDPVFDVEKPVIYLYGYDNEKVNIMLTFKGKVDFTYPKYDTKIGWNVTAQKNGTLKDTNKRNYNYLFWEGTPDKPFEIKEGFCIEGKETVEFLEEKLATLGLTNKEAEDFITYWGPKMEGNTYNVISFLGKEYTDVAKLNVTPRPDQSIRIFMAWYASDEMVEIEKQELTKPEKRTGKTLVEWGGTELKSNTTAKEENTEISEADESSALNQKNAVDMTLEENALKQEQLLSELAVLQNAAALKQQKANNNGHYFVDKLGNSTYFTLNEWQKLVNLWAYTGSPEAVISQYTVLELRNLLNSTP